MVQKHTHNSQAIAGIQVLQQFVQLPVSGTRVVVVMQEASSCAFKRVQCSGIQSSDSEGSNCNAMGFEVASIAICAFRDNSIHNSSA
jgi:hypothetical protein